MAFVKQLRIFVEKKPISRCFTAALNGAVFRLFLFGFAEFSVKKGLEKGLKGYVFSYDMLKCQPEEQLFYICSNTS